MRAMPNPISCALCETIYADSFQLDRCWVIFGQCLYVLCTRCLDERRAHFTEGQPGYGYPHSIRVTVVTGKSTLEDLERRIEKLEVRG